MIPVSLIPRAAPRKQGSVQTNNGDFIRTSGGTVSFAVNFGNGGGESIWIGSGSELFLLLPHV
ncbi:MAG: hypothetical protein MJA83_13395 [Gammaproteobacteria bacterium]|nr:hypothetical protein [Gammaproteobacteria bacterium]